MNKLQINTMFIYSDVLSPSPSSYILFLYHVLPVLHIFIIGAWFCCRAHLFRSGSGSVRNDKRIVVRVGAPPGRWTSPSTNSYAGDSPASGVFNASLSRWELASYVVDSPAFEVFIASSSHWELASYAGDSLASILFLASSSR